MATKGQDRGKKVWRNKGAGLLAQLQATAPSSIPRLIGEPLSTDEYLLAEMAQRQDALGWADSANCETFGEEAGWDVVDMLSAPAAIHRPGRDQHLVGTCGFMGTPAPKYARRLGAVELNATFHDRGGATYDGQAAKYAELGLNVVVKVSGYATHDVGLRDPASWWPWLRMKYAPFVNAGVLVGLFWQLPPSFACTEESCGRLDALGALLRSESQTGSWLELRHAFEFRDSSWFESTRAADIMERHSLTLVCSNITNDTGWAGDLTSGWHGVPAEATNRDFMYVRCFGTSGRSVGSYSSEEMQRIASMVETSKSAVIMFGQGDAPKQALENAWQMKEVLQGGGGSEASDGLPVPSTPERGAGALVSGVVLRRGNDRRVLVDVGGQPGYLGSRHTRRRGLDLRKGAVLKNLRVECEERGQLVLSMQGEAAAEAQEAEPQ